jgi:hypothetical protein
VYYVAAGDPVLIRLHGQGTRRRGRDPGFVQVVYCSDQRLEGKSSRLLTAVVRSAVGLQKLHETMEDMGFDASTAALELSAVAPIRTGHGMVMPM